MTPVFPINSYNDDDKAPAQSIGRLGDAEKPGKLPGCFRLPPRTAGCDCQQDGFLPTREMPFRWPYQMFPLRTQAPISLLYITSISGYFIYYRRLHL